MKETPDAVAAQLVPPLIHVEYTRVVSAETILKYTSQHVRTLMPSPFGNGEMVAEIQSFYLVYPWQPDKPWKYERSPFFTPYGV